MGAIAPSATLAIDAKARALRASGVKVVSYGAGEPDFATPDYIVAAAVEAAGQPASHHYTAVGGLQPPPGGGGGQDRPRLRPGGHARPRC